MSSRFPAAFRPQAFASWASCARQGAQLLTVGLPALSRRALTGFPCSAPSRGSANRQLGIRPVESTRRVRPAPNERGSGWLQVRLHRSDDLVEGGQEPLPGLRGPAQADRREQSIDISA
jgi:hypothetical protein